MDILQIPKTMLILKSSPVALAVVEVFLRNRGWKLHVTSDLKEALSHLMKHKPYYVLLSVDHANKSILTLPKLLGPNYPGVVIPFAEFQTTRSYNELNAQISEYKVSPPVTGPAIERCVNKYLKDLQANPPSSSVVRTATKNESDLYSVKGNGISKTEEVTHITLGALKDGNHFDENGSLRTGMYVDKNEAMNGGLHNSDNEAFGLLHQQKGGEANSSDGNILQSQSSLAAGAVEEQATPKRPIRNSLKPKSPWVPAQETLMERGAQRSLEESSVIGDGRVQQKIQSHTNAACIVIESQRYAGYLVAVMGKDRVIDDSFISSVKGKLYKFLVEHGEEISHEEAMSLRIKQVEFEPWALEYAEFLRKSVHKGDEVAMAFFPRRPIKTILEEAKNKDMVMIGLNDLHGNRTVEFDLFMYLPTNDKYLLYTPKGGVFYDKQLDRLKKQGVTHMHVHKDSAPAVSKYRAENYLNDLVDDFTQLQAGGVDKSKLTA